MSDVNPMAMSDEDFVKQYAGFTPATPEPVEQDPVTDDEPAAEPEVDAVIEPAEEDGVVEPEQAKALHETMHQFNAACNYVAEIAFQMHTAN